MNKHATVDGFNDVQGDNLVAEESLVVDSSSAEAFTVRQNDVGSTVFEVDCLNGEVTINADLIVNGNQTSISTTALEVEDNIIELDVNNTASDARDSGFITHYNDGSEKYDAFYRDATDGDFYLKTGLTTSPNLTVPAEGSAGNLHVGDFDAATVTTTSHIDCSGTMILRSGLWQNVGNTVCSSSGTLDFQTIGDNDLIFSPNTTEMMRLDAGNGALALDADLRVSIDDTCEHRLTRTGSYNAYQISGDRLYLKAYDDEFALQSNARFIISDGSDASVISLDAGGGSYLNDTTINTSLTCERASGADYNLTFTEAGSDSFIITSDDQNTELGSTDNNCLAIRRADGTTVAKFTQDDELWVNKLNTTGDLHVDATTLTVTSDSGAAGGRNIVCHNTNSGDAGIRFRVDSVSDSNNWQAFLSDSDQKFKIGQASLGDYFTLDSTTGAASFADDLTVSETLYANSIDGVSSAITINSSAATTLQYDGNDVLTTSLVGVELRSGGTALGHYEETTLSTTASGPWASGKAVDIECSRVGNMVTVTFDHNNTVDTANSSSAITYSNNLAANFRPGTGHYQMIRAFDNASTVIGMVYVSSAGAVTVYKDETGASFGSSGSVGYYQFSVSYTV